MGQICKNDLLFFETVAQATEGRDLRAAGQVRATLAAFMLAPRTAMKKKIQAVGVSTDFAKLVSDAFSVTVDAVNYDLGWENSYKLVTLGKNQDSWDIYDVANSLTFRLIPEGGRVQVDELSGSLVTARVDYYGGAMGWTDKMIRYRKVAAMIDMAQVFRNKFWANKANNHYLLLATAAAGNVTTYQAGTTQLDRDVTTINRAAFTLTNRVKDKGYDPQNVAEATLLLYANPLDKGRINAAFATISGAYVQGVALGKKIEWNIRVIYTFNSNITANYPILVFPGNKIQRADDMQPTTFTQPKDPLTLNELQAVWAIYGAIVGDTDQCQRINLV